MLVIHIPGGRLLLQHMALIYSIVQRVDFRARKGEDVKQTPRESWLTLESLPAVPCLLTHNWTLQIPCPDHYISLLPADRTNKLTADQPQKIWSFPVKKKEKKDVPMTSRLWSWERNEGRDGGRKMSVSFQTGRCRLLAVILWCIRSIFNPPVHLLVRVLDRKSLASQMWGFAAFFPFTQFSFVYFGAVDRTKTSQIQGIILELAIHYSQLND